MLISYIILENRILDALSVFLSIPLPTNSKKIEDDSHVSNIYIYIYDMCYINICMYKELFISIKYFSRILI